MTTGPSNLLAGSAFAEHQREHEHLHGAFGADRFGAVSEKVARVFGTPYYIVGQTILVAIWIALNTVAVTLRWDPYPFILLYLAFSTQAAYAAPLILLAQTRQAHRDLTSAQAVKRRRGRRAAYRACLHTPGGAQIPDRSAERSLGLGTHLVFERSRGKDVGVVGHPREALGDQQRGAGRSR